MKLWAYRRQVGHHRPGTDPQVGVNLVGIIAEAEALKGLPGGAGEEGQLLFLLLTAQLPEALAHPGPHVAASTADGANGGIVQEPLFKVVLNEPLPLPLQGLVLLADAGKLRLGVAPLLEDGLGRLGHGEAEGPVNLRQPGHLPVGPAQMLGILRLPLRLGLSQALPGPAQHLSCICH